MDKMSVKCCENKFHFNKSDSTYTCLYCLKKIKVDFCTYCKKENSKIQINLCVGGKCGWFKCINCNNLSHKYN
jgi:hypothetical protein